MKQLKRTLLAVLCVLFVASLALSVVACDETANIRDVSVEYDKTRGSITLSNPASDKGYVLKEEVTATVTAFNHYEVASFRVNGVETELTDNTYTFKVTDDTKLAAVFVGNAVNFTVSYEQNEGSVSWTAPVDGVYRYGDTVALTVTPKQGMVVNSVKVNGTTLVPDNGTYSVTLAGNTTVVVNFIAQSHIPQSISASTLASLQGSVLFEGGYDYDDTIDAYDRHYDVITLFDTKANAIWNRELVQGYILYEYVYVNQGDKLVLVEHTLDNKIKYTDSGDDFGEFDNPFIELTVNDFIWIAEGVWSLRSELMRATAVAITGWNESIASFLLFENDGVIDGISITTQFIGEDGDGYKSYYNFEVKEHGTAAVPAEWLAPYEETAAHAELQAALETAANADNYTIAIHHVEDGYEDLDYHMFVTGDVIYENLEGWESGYREMAGLVYPFDYNPETGAGAFLDPLAVNSLANLRASFGGFSPALFEYLGDGVFELRNHDYPLAGDIASAFANGADQQRYYGTATTFKIAIENGVLKQVEFYYNYLGYIAETITLTYSDWDETTVDIDFSEFEMTSVFDSFVGTYSDGAGHTVVIKNGAITINGTEMDIEGFDTEYFMFYGTWDGLTVYVWKLSARQIVVYDKDETFSWTLKLEGVFDPVVIPEEMRGVWEDAEVEAELIVQTYAVILNGTPLEVLSYSDDEGLVCILGDTTYLFAMINDKIYVIVYEDGTGTVTYIFTYKGEYNGIEIPTEWVGEYEGSKSGVTYHISITAAHIVVTIGSTRYTAVITDYDSYEGFTVTLDGTIYYISDADYNPGYDSIVFMSEDMRSLQVILDRVTTGGDNPEPDTPKGNIPQKFVGTFTGKINDEEWSITIAKSSVSVSINGVEQQVSNIECYDYANDVYIFFYIGDVQYCISDASYNDPITTIWLTGGELTYKTLTRTSSGGTTDPEPDTPGEGIPTTWIGEYEGEKNGVTYHISITATSITVTIGGTATVAVIADYDDYEGFTVTLDGAEYYIINADYGYESGPVLEIRLMSGDYYTVNLILTRVD
ncbi:MAG: hypothetical protein J1G02_06510 [Clostridiales bacterium]|nr:hypothetical protein [Clostridiales bacterium]